MKYGERLRLAREHKGLKQDDLAKLSGVKQGTISKIERGDQNSSSFDAELAHALDLEAMWLKTGKQSFAPDWLNGHSKDHITESTADYMQTPDAGRSIHIARISAIDDDIWKSLAPLARAFIENVISKMHSGKLTQEHIKILQSMIDALSKD